MKKDTEIKFKVFLSRSWPWGSYRTDHVCFQNPKDARNLMRYIDQLEKRIEKLEHRK